MLNQISISTDAAPQSAYHRRNAGISAYDSAPTGIKASRGQFIKRADNAQSADAASEESPVSAGIAAANMLAAAPKAEASGIKWSEATIHVYLVTDTVEISGEGRELAAQMSESNSVPADKFIDAFEFDSLSAELGLKSPGPGKTLEERGVTREKGLELAKYVAESLDDLDPAVKQRFLDNVNELIKEADLLSNGSILAVMEMKGGLSVTSIDDNRQTMEELAEKAAADIINRVKDSLDMNAVTEDAMNSLEKIIAEAVPRHKSDDSSF